jgi:hypothetical protein
MQWPEPVIASPPSAASFTGGTPCGNSVFGDPATGTAEACRVLWHGSQ